MAVINVIETARTWRELIGKVGCGGVIITYAGEVQGWVNALPNPKEWVPGCVAVAENGRTWTTLAGNNKQGALMWLPMDPVAD